MKKYKLADRIIREKVDQHSMKAPMHLFTGIANTLDADLKTAPILKKNYWRNGVWMFVLLALIVGGSGIWFLTSNNNSSNETETKMSITLNDNDTNTNIEKSNNVVSDLIVSDNLSSNNRLETINSNLTVSWYEKSKVDQTETNLKLSSVNNPFPNNTSFEATTPKNILTKKGLNSKMGNSLNISTPIFPIEQTSLRKTKGFFVEKPIDEVLSKNVSATTLAKKVYYLPSLAQLATSSVDHSSPYRLAVEPSCGMKSDGSRVKFTTSIDAFFSPDYANQMLEYKSEDFKEHAQLRTDTEKPYYSFNTGIRVNFLTEFGWAIRTGLVYSQINEILETQYTEIVTTFDANGNVIGTIEGTRDVNIRNKYKMIDIPIVFGYEVSMRKFDLNVNGGVYMNLKSMQSGALFSPIEDRVIYFTEGHSDNYDIFKSNIGLSIFMGLGFNFDLTNSFNLDKKIQLIIEPHTRFYPKSFAVENYILNQKYFSTGVMIGLRKYL